MQERERREWVTLQTHIVIVIIATISEASSSDLFCGFISFLSPLLYSLHDHQTPLLFYSRCLFSFLGLLFFPFLLLSFPSHHDLAVDVALLSHLFASVFFLFWDIPRKKRDANVILSDSLVSFLSSLDPWGCQYLVFSLKEVRGGERRIPFTHFSFSSCRDKWAKGFLFHPQCYLSCRLSLSLFPCFMRKKSYFTSRFSPFENESFKFFDSWIRDPTYKHCTSSQGIEIKSGLTIPP